MDDFEIFFSSCFDVGTFARKSLSLMGCEIIQHAEFSFTLSKDQMLQASDPQILLDAVGPKCDSEAKNKKATVFRHVIGKMLYIGRMSAPLVLLHASMAASKLSSLQTHHLRSLALVFKRFRAQGAELNYLSPSYTSQDEQISPILDIISDGAMANRGNDKEREGYIMFRRFDDVIHPIQRAAARLRRVARSSGTAGTLAAADAISSGLYLKALIA